MTFKTLTSNLVLAAIICGGAAMAQISPNSGVPYLDNQRLRLPANQPQAVACASGDLNGDGLQDLVRASRSQVMVWLQDNAGIYTSETLQLTPPTLPGGSADLVEDVAVVSMTNAGFLDVLVGYRSGAVDVFSNSGTGTFAAPSQLPSLSGPGLATLCHLLVGDVKPGGMGEVILILNQQAPVLYDGSVAAGFSQVALAGPTLFEPTGVLADLDGDSLLDLVMVTGDVNNATPPLVYRNNGLTLGTDFTIFPGGLLLPASQVVAADLIPGGALELVFSSLPGGGPPMVFASATTAPLAYLPHPMPSTMVLDAPVHLVARDLDGDSFPDLLALGKNGSLSYGLNQIATPGVLAAAVQVLPAAPRSCMQVMDLEGDGDTDVFVAGAGIEDSMLLGGAAGTVPLLMDTEDQGMPRAARDGDLVAVLDVTGDLDRDLVIYNKSGQPMGLTNLSGQAKFKNLVASPVSNLPVLPVANYRDMQVASVLGTDSQDLLVLGDPTASNTRGMRVLVRGLQTPGSVQVTDQTNTRWPTGVFLRAMAVGDISGSVLGDVGSQGLSDVVGYTSAGNLLLVVNQGGFYQASTVLLGTGIELGSKIFLADLNLDLKLDVVVLQPSLGLRVFLHDPALTDTFIPGFADAAVQSPVGLMVGLGGDSFPDLLVADSASPIGLSALMGDGAGGFFDATGAVFPQVIAPVSNVSSMALVQAKVSNKKSLVLGIWNGPDLILPQQTAGQAAFGAPTTLPFHGSRATSDLLVEDLDLDGDDDLLAVRLDSLPALLLGQSLQMTQVGISQANRETVLRLSLPNTQTGALLAIGAPIVRWEVQPWGIVRLGNFILELPAIMPAAQLQYELRFPTPASFPGSQTNVPVQVFALNFQNLKWQYGNLSVFLGVKR